MKTIESPTYYFATRKYDLSFPRLAEDIDADVVVIGAGFSGINTALELAEQGITNIVVLEAKYLGFGGTGRNGGQVMAGIGHDLNKVKKLSLIHILISSWSLAPCWGREPKWARR